MIPLYYLAPRSTVLAYKDLLHEGCHMVWADQAADTVLVKIRFRTEGDEIHWRQQEGVQPLPHPILEQKERILDHHADKLAKEHGIQRGANVHDVIKRVSGGGNPHSNPLMGLRVF